jgi:hypothetical protein
MFLLHISFLLALALVAAGLVLWHRGREMTGGPLRFAGIILIAGAVISALCIGYYGVRYQVQGDFDRAYAMHPPMEMGRHMMGKEMGMGMMERGERRERMAPPEAGERGGPPQPDAAAEHEAHHPEGAAPR